MSGMCVVRLLGGLGVEVDGRTVPPSAWRDDGADLLVALLALESTHTLTRPQVLERLWPALPEREALKQLDRALRDARKAMHDGRAVTDEGDRLRLWPHGRLWVDAHTFAAMAKHARRPEQRAEAAAAYAGDLLPDLDEPWTEPLRTRLRLVHLELRRDPASGMPPWADLREPVFSGR
jgi:DNA-binding SARP family transcriptional activator